MQTIVLLLVLLVSPMGLDGERNTREKIARRFQYTTRLLEAYNDRPEYFPTVLFDWLCLQKMGYFQ